VLFGSAGSDSHVAMPTRTMQTCRLTGPCRVRKLWGVTDWLDMGLATQLQKYRVTQHPGGAMAEGL